jgi:hypothetical protein
VQAHRGAELTSTVLAVHLLELCFLNLGQHAGDELFSFELRQCIKFGMGRRLAAVEANPLYVSS